MTNQKASSIKKKCLYTMGKSTNDVDWEINLLFCRCKDKNTVSQTTSTRNNQKDMAAASDFLK
jgi:hypothetical protein